MTDLKAIRIIPGTKITHDYMGDQVNTFSYRELVERRTEAVGIPAKQNGLIIVDIDVPGGTHRHDGREWWMDFTTKNNLDVTYTVRSPSGGLHFYYRLPEYINPDTFLPPSTLAPGVDIKYNGWVGAPPTAGYTIVHGNTSTIMEAPQALLDLISDMIKNKPNKHVDPLTGVPSVLELHQPFSKEQIEMLRNKIAWVQENATLSYHEWRDGIFALKAGVVEGDLLEELVLKWTQNKGYGPGDDTKALEMAQRANPQGGIGPGSIFALIKTIETRHGVVPASTPFTVQEIFDKAGIPLSFDKSGKIVIPPTESNAAALIGAYFPKQDLYHDIRNNQYVLRGIPTEDTEIVNTVIPIIQRESGGLNLPKFSKSVLGAGLDVLMQTRRLDPHQEYLKGLVWDGVPRVEKFFTKYCFVPDSQYIRLISKNFWASLGARGMNPGIKFDSMVVLEGPEGIRKSSLCEAIGGKYTYAPFSRNAFQELDDLRQMHQAIVVELPELIGIVGHDSNSVKNFLSKPFDDIRGLYQKRAMKKQRGFIFMGTTNAYRYLNLEMGIRRFWPVRIPSNVRALDLTGVEVDRDQLFAEGVHLYKQGYKFYDVPLELLRPIVSERIIVDPMTEAAKNAIKMFTGRFTVTDVYKSLDIAGFVTKGLTAQLAKRIEDILDLSDTERHTDFYLNITYWVHAPKREEVCQELEAFI